MSGKMFDILGYYYDGHERFLQQIPTKLTFKLKGKFSGWLNGQPNFTYELFSDVKPSGGKQQNLTFASTLNFLIPNYCVADDYGSLRVLETATVNLMYKDKVFKFDHKRIDTIVFTDFFNKIIEIDGTLPLDYTIELEVERINNVEGRHQYLNQNRGNLNPEKYFHKVCNPEFDQSKVGSGHLTSSWSRKNAFKGEIKRSILSLGYKDSTVFAIEYLYGLKLPKNSTYRQVFDKLAQQPYNDFGIRDVQVMTKLLTVFNRKWNTEKQLHEGFQNAGVKPATTLVRWQKDIQPKELTTNEVPF